MIVFIVNPRAGKGAAARAIPTIERAMAQQSAPLDIRRTSGPGDTRRLTRAAAAEGAEVVVAVGGDGSVHEVANALLEAGAGAPALGVIPVGSGNDFAR